jgi:hypothetical protein
MAVALAATILALIVARAARRLSATVFVVAVIAVLAVDLLFFGRGFHPVMPPEHVFPRLPEIEAVRRDPDLFRVTGLGNNLLPNAALVYGLQDFRGYDGMSPMPYGELLDAAFEGDPPFHQATRFEEPRLLDLLNVKYIFMPSWVDLPEGRYTKLDVGPGAVYRNNRAFPRAFLVDRYEVRTGNDARRILRDGRVNLRRSVLLEADPPAEARPQPAPDAAAPGRVRVTHYRPEFVEIETDADAARLLVLTDAHYPGWDASVDEAPAPIYRANFAFRAVPVPAGRHVVRFEYRPTSFRIGAALSGATALALALAAVPAWRKRRRGIGGPASDRAGVWGGAPR